VTKFVFILTVVCLQATELHAQGQDSQTSERDLQVIEQMFGGVYDNANQAYFDGRRGLAKEQRHARLTVSVSKSSANSFELELAKHDDSATVTYDAKFEHLIDSNLVGLSLTNRSDLSKCEYHWRRGPEHFSATRVDTCKTEFPETMSLSKNFLWLGYQGSKPYSLHRSRPFSCYADMPGVGGGRDIPFKRYDNFNLHDRGGSVWFDTIGTADEPSRRLKISMLLVDWPINNYQGAFARDSLVMYVSEKIGHETKEHGYTFTVPEADRIGLNLKWILVNCYQTAPSDATPEM